MSEIEEIVNELKFEVTGKLVEDIIQVQASQQAGPGPKCESCGREMRYKGKKKRPAIQTSQGEIDMINLTFFLTPTIIIVAVIVIEVWLRHKKYKSLTIERMFP